MVDIEIPQPQERSRRYRLFEILPGLISWLILALPFALSLLSPIWAAAFIIAYLLIWLFKAIGMLVRNIQGLRTIGVHEKLNWTGLVSDLESLNIDTPVSAPEWHLENLYRVQAREDRTRPSEIYHAVIIAAYNESRQVLEPTVRSVLNSEYDTEKFILVMAYEERGGKAIKQTINDLIDEYGSNFGHAMAVMHPENMPGEITGKGGNVTFAGRELQKYIESQDMSPKNIVVTTLDSDNRPHPKYFSALAYYYCVAPDPVKASYQPVPKYTNNIWDAPAPMRVIATGNTFWNVVLSLRPHMIRNFAAHAQSMQTLLDTDYWSVRTVVEDGHQFWRTYFRYEGQHDVYPIYLPITQDAVLSNTLWKTLKAQFLQLRRWAWGVSDIAYVVEKGFFTPNKVPKFDLIMKLGRLVDSHISWATAALLIAFSAFIPALLNPDDFTANQLPLAISRIQQVALLGLATNIFLSMKLLPPRPARYKRRRSVLMVLQWVLMPPITIIYNASAALNSQTRLMFGRYLGKFDVTDKAVVTEDKRKIM